MKTASSYDEARDLVRGWCMRARWNSSGRQMYLLPDGTYVYPMLVPAPDGSIMRGHWEIIQRRVSDGKLISNLRVIGITRG